MTVFFTTRVLDVPPTPLGLLPRRFVVTHACQLCREVVPSELLVDHAKGHGGQDAGQEPPGSA